MVSYRSTSKLNQFPLYSWFIDHTKAIRQTKKLNTWIVSQYNKGTIIILLFNMLLIYIVNTEIKLHMIYRLTSVHIPVLLFLTILSEEDNLTLESIPKLLTLPVFWGLFGPKCWYVLPINEYVTNLATDVTLKTLLSQRSHSLWV